VKVTVQGVRRVARAVLWVVELETVGDGQKNNHLNMEGVRLVLEHRIVTLQF